VAEHKRKDVKRKIERVEARLEELLDCITPENKDLITEKMVALRKERDSLRVELENTAALDAQAASSTKMVGRLVEVGESVQGAVVGCDAGGEEGISFLYD